MDEDDPNSGGLSRKALEQELDASLDRLGMDTIDLYQIHRWDDDTPIETTLRAFDDAVRRGDIRHAGASSMWARQFADSLRVSERKGLARFETMQNHYNLVYREEEREMLPLCGTRGRGRHSLESPGPRVSHPPPREDRRDHTGGETEEHMYEHPYREGGGREVNERVEELAGEYDLTMAQVALSWLLHKDWVDAPIVGTTSVEHLEDAVEALDVLLDGERRGMAGRALRAGPRVRARVARDERTETSSEKTVEDPRRQYGLPTQGTRPPGVPGLPVPTCSWL